MKKILLLPPVHRRYGISRIIRKNHILMIIFSLILFSGIVYGAVSGRNAQDELVARLDVILRANYDLRSTPILLNTFISSFASYSVFLITVVLLGASLWGIPLLFFVPFIKGYGYGLSVGFLYSTNGFWGILYNILIVIPGFFISSIVLMISCIVAFTNSVKINAFFLRSAVKDDPHSIIKDYLSAICRILLFYALTAVLDVMTSLCFSWIFSL